MNQHVTLTATDGHQLDAYVSTTAGTPKGAVVVLQEIFGVNPQIRQVADDLAALGYLAIAPALFDRYERGVELTDQGEDMKRAFAEFYPKLSPETALLDVAAASKFVQRDTPRTAVMGFCYGGMLSWLASTRAASLGITPAAVVGYYPGGIGNFATEQPTCPVMLHFGAADSHIGADQRDAVQAAHPEVEIFVYPGADHAFAGTARSAYNLEQAKIAWERTTKFLANQLG